MVTDDLLLRFFQSQLEKLRIQHNLTDDERERIIEVFKMAMADHFMDEHQIWQKLIAGRGTENGDQASPA